MWKSIFNLKIFYLCQDFKNKKRTPESFKFEEVLASFALAYGVHIELDPENVDPAQLPPRSKFFWPH